MTRRAPRSVKALNISVEQNDTGFDHSTPSQHGRTTLDHEVRNAEPRNESLMTIDHDLFSSMSMKNVTSSNNSMTHKFMHNVLHQAT